jgi:hypothetical protein
MGERSAAAQGMVA